MMVKGANRMLINHQMSRGRSAVFISVRRLTECIPLVLIRLSI